MTNIVPDLDAEREMIQNAIDLRGIPAVFPPRATAVIPRKFPADAAANATTPAEWWNSHALQMTGHPPRSGSDSDHTPQPQGEAPAVGNGSAPNAQPAQAPH